MDEFKLSQKVKEIQQLIDIDDYNPTIEKIIRRIYNHQCKVGRIEPNNPYPKRSVHDPITPTVAEPYRTIIRLKLQYEFNTKDYLWDILHEFGHHLDLIKLPSNFNKLSKVEQLELRKPREIRAWEIADDEFKLYEDLDYNDYLHYQKFCLNTYFHHL